MVSELNTLASNLCSNVSIIARSLFGSVEISTPDSEGIESALKSAIYEIWDAFDDYWFLDKEKYTFKRSIKQSNEYMDKATTCLKNWASEFYDSVFITLQSQSNEVSLYQELVYYKSYANSLEPFCEEFISIDYFKQAFLSN